MPECRTRHHRQNDQGLIVFLGRETSWRRTTTASRTTHWWFLLPAGALKQYKRLSYLKTERSWCSEFACMKGTVMIDTATMDALLDSMRDPVVFVDTHHVVQYMNEAAIHHYDEGVNLIGCLIFSCHNEQSCKKIVEVFLSMQNGTDEELITDNEKHRIYMRAVRDRHGQLVGYHERYEPKTQLHKRIDERRGR